MTLNDINKLTVDDVIRDLTYRLIKLQDTSSIAYGLQWFWFKTAPENYDNLVLHESLTKPTLQQFEDELVIYKSELIAEENERLRIENLKIRWRVIMQRDAGVPAFYAIVKDQSNASWYINNLIEDKSKAIECESLMSQIEIMDVGIIKSNADKKKRNDLIAIGKKEKEMCDNVQYLLAGYISKMTITEQQKTKLKADFKSAQDKLTAADQIEAKKEIEKLSTDSIFTAEIKEALLKELK